MTWRAFQRWLAETGRAVVVADGEALQWLRSLRGRRFAGYGGIRVHETADSVSIVGQDFRPRRSGGGEAPFVSAQITAFTSGNLRMMVKRIDPEGELTGDDLEVYAYSLPPVDGEIGQQDLSNCLPPYEVGDPIEISYRRVWTGTQWISAWWSVGQFVVYGCAQGS